MSEIPYSPIYAKRLSSCRGHIYFIATESEPQLVKIGHTARCPLGRMRALQTGCPHKLRLALIIDGSVQDERNLHQKFANRRYRAEWFLLDGPVSEFIENARE